MAVMDQETAADTPNANFDPEPLSPPPLLLWLIVGLFLLSVAGTAGGVLVFKNVLRPGQQQRIITILPFMQNFLPVRPGAGIALPTAIAAQNNGITPEDLLAISIAVSTPTASVHEVLAEPSATLPPPTVEPTSVPTTNLIEVAAVPEEAAKEFPPFARNYGFRHVQQGWNNCGPASITIALSYYGWEENQEFSASFLKPDREDKNVTPREMVSFVNEQTGVRALTRMGGSLDLLKSLTAGGFPVLVSLGYMPEGYDWLGHYLTVVGYDDRQQAVYVYDSFLGTGDNGEGMAVAYSELDRDWQQFNRTFIVLYRPDEENRIREILGELADPTQAAEHALQVAQEEARANPQNGFAWFNIGTALVALGRDQEAATAYDQARQLNLPWRMLWYQFGPYEAYFNVGRYDDVLALVEANLNNGVEYVEETYYWQGRVFAARGQTDEAAAAFNQALLHNSRYIAAEEALTMLEAD